MRFKTFKTNQQTLYIFCTQKRWDEVWSKVYG
jgi:hypothetical protein